MLNHKKMQIVTLGVLVLSCSLFSSSFVFGYDPSVATYTWDATVPNYNPAAVIHPGIIDISFLVMGDFLGVGLGQPNAPGYGDSGVSVGWDDTWAGGVGHPNTNGDHLDGLWAQIIYPSEGWWDLGLATNRVVVFLSQDHGPYLEEGLEVRVYGSNTLWGAVSTQAVLIDIYLDGWRIHDASEDANGNGWCSDDIAAVFQLPGMYRYVKIAAWSSVGALNEPEVDAVARVGTLVYVDIKPGSWPNPIKTASKGVFAVAICGTEDFDVMLIDPATIMITMEGLTVGVSPIRWTYEDVATPYIGPPGGGHALGGDGYLDLVLHFDTQEVVNTLGLSAYVGQTVPLVITGYLYVCFTPIKGQDYVWILDPPLRERRIP